MPSSQKRIIITAGGTGGHLYPAQALAQQLTKTLSSPDLLFAAGELSTSQFFDRTQFKFKDVQCSGLSKHPIKLLKNSFKIFKGVRESLKIIRQFKPDLVVGFGSYYTIPILLASKICKIPFVLHEANSIPGKANKWLAPYATSVGVHFPMTIPLLKGKIVEVGLPIREGYNLSVSKEVALDYYHFSAQSFTILIFGGSQGAAAINQLLEESLPYLNGLKIQFIHLVGKNESIASMSSLYKKYLFSACIKNYEEKMQFAWKSADLFIGRAGASSIAEAVEFETPGILIPYPHATEDHQSKNADFFTKHVQGGVKLKQKDLTGRELANEIRKIILANSSSSMQEAIRSYKTKPKFNFCDLIMQTLRS